MIFAALFLLGMSYVNFASITAVTHCFWFIMALPCLASFKKIFPRSVVMGALMLVTGVIWGLLNARWNPWMTTPYLANRTEHFLTGIVASEMDKKERSKAFIFETDIGRVYLDWYGYSPLLIPGQKWQLNFRLIPIKQYHNEAGFDYAKWLMLKGIVGKGYVLTRSSNRWVEDTNHYQLLRYRLGLQERLQHTQLKHWEIISGLTLGLRNHMTDDVWQLLRKTNTTHLLAISGLHIGMMGGFAFMCFRSLWRWSFTLTAFTPAKVAASVFGLSVSFVYAMMAGFSIPTQRAFIMIGTGFVNNILRKPFFTWQSFIWALGFVLLTQPLSVMSIGFWLSFLAAFCLIFILSNRKYTEVAWLRVQLSVSLFLFPWLLVFFKEVALVGWVANFIAIPMVSFIILPLAFLGVFLFALDLGWLAKPLFICASIAIDYLLKLLGLFADFPIMHWLNATSSTLNVVLACIGVCIILLPRGVPGRLSGLLMILPLITQSPRLPLIGECRFNFLDVGHGLSVLIQTRQHALLYDIGTPFVTRSVLLPFLFQRGINTIDKIVISHPDFDHLGVINFLTFQYPQAKLESSDLLYSQKPNTLCRAGMVWEWDGVQFEYLHPTGEQPLPAKNDNSCVLKITAGKHSFLLTADISRRVETMLTKRYGEKLQSQGMLVPHHGSRHASSGPFLKMVKPTFAIVSTEYTTSKLADVLSRYQALGIPVHSTKHDGQIEMMLSKDGFQLKSYRQMGHMLWYDVELRQS